MKKRAYPMRPTHNAKLHIVILLHSSVTREYECENFFVLVLTLLPLSLF